MVTDKSEIYLKIVCSHIYNFALYKRWKSAFTTDGPLFLHMELKIVAEYFYCF